MRKWSRLALHRAGPFSIFAFNPGLRLFVEKVAENSTTSLRAASVTSASWAIATPRSIQGSLKVAGWPVSLLTITPCGFSTKRHLRQVGALSDWMRCPKLGHYRKSSPALVYVSLHSRHCRMGSSRPKSGQQL